MRAAHDIKRNFAQTRFSAGRHCRVSRKELDKCCMDTHHQGIALYCEDYQRRQGNL